MVTSIRHPASLRYRWGSNHDRSATQTVTDGHQSNQFFSGVQWSRIYVVSLEPRHDDEHEESSVASKNVTAKTYIYVVDPSWTAAAVFIENCRFTHHRVEPQEGYRYHGVTKYVAIIVLAQTLLVLHLLLLYFCCMYVLQRRCYL